MGKIFNSGIFNVGAGAYDKVPLLSITTEPHPVGGFEKGSKYFNSSDSKIYTAVSDDTWENAKISDPQWGTYYVYDNKAYIWDGNSLEYFELEEYQRIANITNSYTSTSTTTYPSSKALADGLATKGGVVRNFADAGIEDTTASYTFIQLAEEIRLKQFPTGTILYGEVSNQGMPSGINNSELRVEVLETKTSLVNPAGSQYKSQVLGFTLFSTDVEPNEWTFLYYDRRDTPWVWVPKAKQPFVGTDGQTDGVIGLVPAPTTTDVDKVLKSDGTWGNASSPVTFNFSGPYVDPTTLPTRMTLANYDTINVYKNGVLLEKSLTSPVAVTNDYSISGNNIVFTEALANSDKIAIIASGVVIDGGSGALALEKVQGIEPLIPAEATSSNKLADKAYVANTIASNIASFVTSTDVRNIVTVTQAQYDAMVQAGTIVATTFYAIIPES